LIGCSPIAIAVPCKPPVNRHQVACGSLWSAPRFVGHAAAHWAVRGHSPSRRSARGPSRRHQPVAAARINADAREDYNIRHLPRLTSRCGDGTHWRPDGRS
jgi:hypothetical protein